MKYMGSKRAMLQNGLGVMLSREVPKSKRFVDLFTGSGAVAWHVAREFPIEVQAYDLQSYGVVLAEAVLGRTRSDPVDRTWIEWHNAAAAFVKRRGAPSYLKLTQKIVAELRNWCADQHDLLITRVYGGHYFSPVQAVWIDGLLRALPEPKNGRTLALASLIEAASACAAAPGHTAQPFQPTRTAKPFLKEAWDRDVCSRTEASLKLMGALYAKKKGFSAVGDANHVAKGLKKGDLVFLDPPYSGVHYSRFYHVLETIARGECGEVTGVGRYPDRDCRPRSKYSVTTESAIALSGLIETLAGCGARVLLTFPDHECSNGLSGSKVREIVSRHYDVAEQSVKSKFSTLGGNSTEKNGQEGRAARQSADELILVLSPN